MTTPSWMLLRLALDTRQHHARADADRIALMDVADDAAYRRHLARIYGFEVAVEDALAKIRDLEPQVVAARRRAELLRRDLAALGLSAAAIAALPRCAVTIANPAQAFGWLFVVERLTLLAGLIRRHLGTQLPGAVLRASAYLTSSALDAGARFRAFGDDCARYARRGATEPTAMVAAANLAFGRQRDWYAKLRVCPAATPPCERSRASEHGVAQTHGPAAPTFLEARDS